MMFLLPFLPSLTPSIPLSHYVLLFHITAKQFEAQKGSPPPILAPSFLPSPHSSSSYGYDLLRRGPPGGSNTY